MSTRDTDILDTADLRYLLLESLKLYSDNVEFLDGSNPYRFSINKKTFYIWIRNVHESGRGRPNEDECRIQVSRSNAFDQAMSSGHDVIFLGYLADDRVFTAWNPYLMRERINRIQNGSLYSRFSIQREAARTKVSIYRDNDDQSIISFCPQYLGLYLENLEKIHLLPLDQIKDLVRQSDAANDDETDSHMESVEGLLTISHSRTKRDPLFRKIICEAYDYRCAMCGIQLDLIEAAHIVPHAHDKGTDEIGNGISLCVLHHKAYDRSLIYFNERFEISINQEKVRYLEKMQRDSGLGKFQELAFAEVVTPRNRAATPILANITLANRIRGIGNG